MINRKDDISHYLGRALFIVLFFILVAAFSDQPLNKTTDAPSCELVTNNHIYSSQAVATVTTQVLPFHLFLITSIDKSGIGFHNPIFKITNDNKKIAQQLKALYQTEIQIKPLAIFRIYYPPQSKEPEVLPILS